MGCVVVAQDGEVVTAPGRSPVGVVEAENMPVRTV